MKNNNFSQSAKKLKELKEKKQDIQEPTDDSSKSSEFEDKASKFSEDLEREHKRENIKDIQIARVERKKYAQHAFWFMCGFAGIVVLIVIFSALDIVICSVSFSLQPMPLVALIGTIPASMALFGWVLKGLFPPNTK